MNKSSFASDHVPVVDGLALAFERLLGSVDLGGIEVRVELVLVGGRVAKKIMVGGLQHVLLSHGSLSLIRAH